MSTIWISYDLGVSGDYEGMYEWLDDHSATECGSSVAFVKQYEHDGDDLMQALRRDIQGSIEIDKAVENLRDTAGRWSGEGQFSLWSLEAYALGRLWPTERDHRRRG